MPRRGSSRVVASPCPFTEGDEMRVGGELSSGPRNVASLPRGRHGQAWALGVTLVGLALLWSAMAQPLLDAHAAAAQALARRQVLASRMAGLAGSLPQLRAAVASLRAQATPVVAVFEGGTDAIAAAALQGSVEIMAARAGARLTSAEALPAEPAGDYRRLALRITVDATWPVLVKLLLLVEQATPRMFVDDLQLHATTATQTTRELPLDISLTLLAFRAADAAPTARAGVAAP